ncbi:MAG: hypothetical protein WDZ90_00025 [Candidatus Paceibacterota bacterium]
MEDNLGRDAMQNKSSLYHWLHERLIRRHYPTWKKHARTAIAEKRTARCAGCDDPIIPGDFVGVCYVEGEAQLIHAGYHRTLDRTDAFCETGAIGSGIWDGEKYIRFGESAAESAFRTGEPQFRKY